MTFDWIKPAIRRLAHRAATGALAIAATIAATIAGTAPDAHAAVPRTTSLQGILTDAGGQPVADGHHDLTVRIYNAASGGTLLWQETHDVNTEGGLFSVVLGSTNTLDISFANPTWITTEVDGNGELTNRLALTGTPYALTARTVEAGGVGASQIADDTVVRSLNGLTDDVTISGNGGISVSEVGDTIIIDGAGGGGGSDSDWLVDGEDMYSIPQGQVGIGTSDPSSNVHIFDPNGSTTLRIEDGNTAAGFHTSVLFFELPNAVRSRLEFFKTTSGDPTLNVTSNSGDGMDIRLNAKELLMISEEPAVVRIAGNDRARFGSNLELLDANGAETVEFNMTPAGRLSLKDDDGPGALRLNGSLGSGGEINAFSDTGEPGFRLQAERATAGGGAIAWLYDEAGSPTAALNGAFHGSAGERGGELSLYASNTNQKTVEITAQENADLGQGGQILLNTVNGATRLELDGDVGDAGSIVMRDASGAATIRLDAGDAGGGRITTEVIEITGGADLSEHFDVGPGDDPAEIEPGMVVRIDASNPGALVLADEAYDSRVAGVISGAGGVKPGMLMGQRGSVADGEHPVALTGRVYARADASFGAIEPGDLLTTSPAPGHAMVASDRARAGGAILGKAMTSLDEGRGLVLVLVALQ